jgi:hypothetical protein
LDGRFDIKAVTVLTFGLHQKVPEEADGRCKKQGVFGEVSEESGPPVQGFEQVSAQFFD